MSAPTEELVELVRWMLAALVGAPIIVGHEIWKRRQRNAADSKGKGRVMTSKDFKAGRRILGLSVSQCAEQFGVDPRTIRRWEDGSRAVPGTAEKLMELLLNGRDGKSIDMTSD